MSLISDLTERDPTGVAEIRLRWRCAMMPQQRDSDNQVFGFLLSRYQGDG